jgi:hypothetical protein
MSESVSFLSCDEKKNGCELWAPTVDASLLSTGSSVNKQCLEGPKSTCVECTTRSRRFVKACPAETGLLDGTRGMHGRPGDNMSDRALRPRGSQSQPRTRKGLLGHTRTDDTHSPYRPQPVSVDCLANRRLHPLTCVCAKLKGRAWEGGGINRLAASTIESSGTRHGGLAGVDWDVVRAGYAQQ